MQKISMFVFHFSKLLGKCHEILKSALKTSLDSSILFLIENTNFYQNDPLEPDIQSHTPIKYFYCFILSSCPG